MKKDKVKQRMVDFITDSYWINDKYVQYKDIKEKFVGYISEGTISNYLDELVENKKLYRMRNGKSVFYGPPRMSFSLAFGLLISIPCLSLTILFYIIQNLNIVLLMIGFEIGIVFTSVVFAHNEENKNNQNWMDKVRKKTKRKKN